MIRTFTTPKSLIADSRSLTEQSVDELLDDCQLTQDLIEEFRDVEITAPQSIVERALAYSASHKVQPSKVMGEGNLTFLN